MMRGQNSGQTGSFIGNAFQQFLRLDGIDHCTHFGLGVDQDVHVIVRQSAYRNHSHPSR